MLLLLFRAGSPATAPPEPPEVETDYQGGPSQWWQRGSAASIAFYDRVSSAADMRVREEIEPEPTPKKKTKKAIKARVSDIVRDERVRNLLADLPLQAEEALEERIQQDQIRSVMLAQAWLSIYAEIERQMKDEEDAIIMLLSAVL